MNPFNRKPASSAPPAFTYESLIQLIERNSVTSLDALLPLLPENFRSNYAIVYRSESLQEASEPDPRIVMYAGDDARLLMAFNGKSSQKGYRNLEVIQYRDDTATFEFREITFPFDRAHLPEKNPAKCLACHGQQPKPNWEGYFLWPGVIGGHDGDLIGNDIRRKNSVDWPHGRYQYLKPAIQEPNSNLARLLGFLNGRKMARLVMGNPTLLPYRYAILGAAICDGSRFPVDDFLTAPAKAALRSPYASVLADTIQRNRDYFLNRRYQLIVDLGTVDGHSVLEGKRAMQPQYESQGSEDSEAIARVRYIIEGLGVSMAQWDLPLDPGSYSFNDGSLGVRNPGWWQPLLSLKQDAELRRALQAHDLGFCTALSEKSRALLAGSR